MTFAIPRPVLIAALAALAAVAAMTSLLFGAVDLSLARLIAAATRERHSRRFVQFLLFGADGLTRAWRRGEDIRVFGAGPGLHADLAGPIVRHPAVLEALLVDSWGGPLLDRAPVLGANGGAR